MIVLAGKIVYIHGPFIKDVNIGTFYKQSESHGSWRCYECGKPIFGRIYYAAIDKHHEYCCSFDCAVRQARVYKGAEEGKIESYVDQKITGHPEICIVCGDLTHHQSAEFTICRFCMHTYIALKKANPPGTTPDQLIQDCQENLSADDIKNREIAQDCKQHYMDGHPPNCYLCAIAEEWCPDPETMDRRFRGQRADLEALDTFLF